MKGQALVTLIFFTVIATTVTTAAILVIGVNSISGTRVQEGVVAYQIAQSGADNALIRLLRDPSYVGETLSVGSGSATVQVVGSGTTISPYVISSKGQKGFYIKKVEVNARYENETLNVISHKEVF
ncbi:MAG TPA: hypothetical protein VM077_01315 [Candidatus Limnocylindrales bacterium]|nr:hypothetical protein [Candidatus Limnocylindrales bacterium]